jgi:hypothetical protein
MATMARGIAAARRATVELCDQDGTYRGQGLALALDDVGVTVLTCHHVIAPVAPERLRVRFSLPDESLGEPLPAKYDAAHWHPAMDIVALRMDGVQLLERPLLYTLDPDAYNGSLPATGLSYLMPNNFRGKLRRKTPLRVPLARRARHPST